MLNKKLMTIFRNVSLFFLLIILQPIASAIEDELILANIPEEVREKALEDLNSDASDLNQAIADGAAPRTPKQIKLQKQIKVKLFWWQMITEDLTMNLMFSGH